MAKAQVSLEYLTITAFILVVVIIIFSITALTSDQNIKARQISESLEALVQTADLVYAMGKGNVLTTDVVWPMEVSSISIEHKCKTSSELTGCTGGQAEACSCGTGECTDDNDCIKYSAVKLIANNGQTELLYPSKAKLYIDESSAEFLANNVNYVVKVSWTDTGLVKLERKT